MPKHHSKVLSVATPTVLVPVVNAGWDLNCGNDATGSWFEVGVKRARNDWLVSENEPLNGAAPLIVSALTAEAVVAWLAREYAPIQYCRKSSETFTQFSSWPTGPTSLVFERHCGLSGKRPSGL